MKATINNIEFTTCSFIACDGARVNGLFVHDLADEFGSGDGVIADVELPENQEEAETLLINEYLDTNGATLASIEW